MISKSNSTCSTPQFVAKLGRIIVDWCMEGKMDWCKSLGYHCKMGPKATDRVILCNTRFAVCVPSSPWPVKVRSWRRSLLKVVTRRQRSWNEVDCPCVWNNKENSNTIPTTHQFLIGFFNYRQSILGYPHLCRTPSPCILRYDFPQEEVQCLLVAASCREGKDSQKADRATV